MKEPARSPKGECRGHPEPWVATWEVGEERCKGDMERTVREADGKLTNVHF